MVTKIISDSSCDLYSAEDGSFSSVPLTITTDYHSYTDDASLNLSEMLAHLSSYKGKSHTACPSVDCWIKAFGEAEVIYIVTMTSALSGTYNSAIAARNTWQETHPGVFIHIFDTLTTGPEQRLFIEKLQELIQTEETPEEVVRKAEEYRSKTRLFFVLKSLHNLAQNGRVNKALAQAISLLGISILATASPEGTITPISKCRSARKVIASILTQLKQAGCQGRKIYISHVDNSSLAEALKETLQREFPKACIKTYPATGLCSYYAERGGILIGCECF